MHDWRVEFVPLRGYVEFTAKVCCASGCGAYFSGPTYAPGLASELTEWLAAAEMMPCTP